MIFWPPVTRSSCSPWDNACWHEHGHDLSLWNNAVSMNDTIARSMISLAEARRLEEYALNASGAFQSLIYDGWLLGFRPGSTKRLRCVNAFYASTLPIGPKIDHCRRFYQDIRLPPLFRLLPFSQPPELDSYLERDGWIA